MTVACSMYKETFPGKPTWSVNQIPDLTGQVMIVTGGNAGIGRETCKALLNKGAKVYLAARSKSKADDAIEWLKSETGGREPVFLQLDIADLESVRRAAEEFRQYAHSKPPLSNPRAKSSGNNRKEETIDVLFNNGGVMAPLIEMKTARGYDIQFGTNPKPARAWFLRLFYCPPTPAWTDTCYKGPRGHARVVNVSSSVHWLAPKGGVDYSTLIPNDVDSEARRRKVGTQRLYAQSKWGNIAFSNELARRHESQGIISTSLHPRGIKTELQRHSTLTGVEESLRDSILWPAPYGALTQLYAGTVPEGDKFSGQVYFPDLV